MESTKEQINRIARNEALLAVAIALAIDFAIILVSYAQNDYRWLISNGFWWKILLASSLMPLIGAYFARRFASKIVQKGYWAFWGMLCAWLTLAVTVLATGLLSFLIDLCSGAAGAKDFFVYTVTSFLLVMIYSFIPVGLHGIWFGYRIYSKGQTVFRSSGH